jgi:hypothetical protein
MNPIGSPLLSNPKAHKIDQRPPTIFSTPLSKMPPFLPVYFAIFEDDSARTQTMDVCYIGKRFKIMSAKYKETIINGCADIVECYRIVHPTVTLYELARGCSITLSGTMKDENCRDFVHVSLGQPWTFSDVRTMAWDTGLEIYYDQKNLMIPVIGFVDHEKIKAQYVYTYPSDTLAQCSARGAQQQRQRELVLRYYNEPSRPAPAPTAPPMPAPAVAAPPRLSQAPSTTPSTTPSTATPPPKFVSEIMLRDAITREECCPISMTPFKECSSVCITSCFHLFEKESLQAWLRTSHTCPVCKQAMGTPLDISVGPKQN